MLHLQVLATADRIEASEVASEAPVATPVVRKDGTEEPAGRLGRGARVAAQMTLPNWLTLLRLCLIPFIALSLYGSFAYHDQVAAVLYGVAALTDTLDGHLARSRNQTTQLGKFLDPLADKLLVITVLAILVGQETLSAWVVVVIFAREFLITGLRSIAASQGVVMSSTPWGKSKTLTQNIMIGLVILQRPYPWLETPAKVAVAVAVTATVLSGLDYLWRYRRFVVH